MFDWLSNMFSSQNAPATYGMMGSIGSALSPQGSAGQKLGDLGANYAKATQYKNYLDMVGANNYGQALGQNQGVYPTKLKMEFSPHNSGQINQATGTPAGSTQTSGDYAVNTPQQQGPMQMQQPANFQVAQMLGGRNPFQSSPNTPISNMSVFGLTPAEIESAYNISQNQQKLNQAGMVIPSEIDYKNALAQKYNSETRLADPEFKLKQDTQSQFVDLKNRELGIHQFSADTARIQADNDSKLLAARQGALEAEALGRRADADRLNEEVRQRQEFAYNLRLNGTTVNLGGKEVPAAGIPPQYLADFYRTYGSGSTGAEMTYAKALYDTGKMSWEEALTRAHTLKEKSESSAKHEIGMVLLQGLDARRFFENEKLLSDTVDKIYNALNPTNTRPSPTSNPNPPKGNGTSGTKMLFDSNGNYLGTR